MLMNSKRIISLVIFVCLFCTAGLVFADPGSSSVSIVAPAGVPTDFPTLLGNIASKAGEIVAVIGTIMIIVAGIFYLTSAGSPERIGVAKKALLYAIVGIVIGLAAKAISDAILQVING